MRRFIPSIDPKTKSFIEGFIFFLLLVILTILF